MREATAHSALRRYLPHAAVSTFVIAALPVWAGIAVTENSWIATFVAIALSLALTHLLGLLWQHHPGSEDVVFGDLMLWSYLRRLRTHRGLTKQLERLGLGKPDRRDEPLTREQQLRFLKRLAISLEAGDPYLNGHTQRVARHASMIAKFMKLPRREREKIRLAGLLHDVGKLYVPAEILNKPDRLTDDEFEIVKKHAPIGSEIVARLGDDELTAMVRHHHERIDGTGYPDKRAGMDIPLGARILAVADTFDALTSRRAYRPAQKHKLAIGILQKEARHQLDSDAVKAFLRYYTGFRSIGRWFFLTGGFSHGAELAFAWTQKLGLAGVANAAVAGGTAVAIATAPLVSSHVLQREDGSRRPVAAARQEVPEVGAAPLSLPKKQSSKDVKGSRAQAPGPNEKAPKPPRDKNNQGKNDRDESGAVREPGAGRNKKESKTEEEAVEETATTDPGTTESDSETDATTETGPGQGNAHGRDKNEDDGTDSTDPVDPSAGKGKKDKDS